MKKIPGIAIVAALLLASSIASADRPRHAERFCAAVGELNDDMAKLDRLEPRASVHDLRDIAQRIRRDANAIERDAADSARLLVTRFDNAMDRLVNRTEALPTDLTMSQVRDRIDDDVRGVKLTAQRLANDAGCTEAPPNE
jgi:hypothetical protein